MITANPKFQKFTHIYPVNDLRTHDLEGTKCWCLPEVDDIDEIIVHNSLDGREKFENKNQETFMTAKNKKNKKTGTQVATIETRPVGRPTGYRSEYCEEVTELCKLGATDEDIKAYFDISLQTMYNWRNQYPEFLVAIKKGKIVADMRVANRLHNRATGYEYIENQAIKLKEIVYGENGKKISEIERVEIVAVQKVAPPDTTAQIFWLKNRKPDAWRDRRELEVGRPGDFAALKDDELRKSLMDDLEALGIEIDEAEIILPTIPGNETSH